MTKVVSLRSGFLRVELNQQGIDIPNTSIDHPRRRRRRRRSLVTNIIRSIALVTEGAPRVNIIGIRKNSGQSKWYPRSYLAPDFPGKAVQIHPMA